MNFGPRTLFFARCSPMQFVVFALVSLFLAGSRCDLSNQEVFDASPYVSLRWSWEISFHYFANDSANTTSNILFKPTSSAFDLLREWNENSENNTMTLVIKPDVTGFRQLVDANLTVLVERFAEYFAWTNMTMQFKFAENTGEPFPTESQTVKSSSQNKFFTRIDEIYECESRIPVPMGPNVTIVFSNMMFQAFDAEKNPSADRLREVCPRDFKSSIPITILTGCSLLLIFVVAAVIFGVTIFLDRRKSKEN